VLKNMEKRKRKLINISRHMLTKELFSLEFDLNSIQFVLDL